MKIDITDNLAHIRKKLGGISDRVFPSAVPRAINDTLGHVQSVIAHDLANENDLKLAAVKSQIAVQRAGRAQSSWFGELRATGQRIWLSGIKGIRQTARGAVYKVKGKKVTEAHTFRAKMKSGHIGYFVRYGSRKRPAHQQREDKQATWLPIKERTGPSLKKLFVDKKIDDTMSKESDPYIFNRLNYWLQYYLTKIAR